MKNYININKNSWNNKVDFHLKSDFYFVEEFIQGRNSLNAPELDLLGDITGKEILHLQCHFGQDSISLSRMGAKVTGVDFSDQAILAAERLAKTCQTDTKFICSDIYELPKVLNQKFDIVFTSYGTIGWLPNLDKWSRIISHYLKEGGKFIFVEFHPVVWMFDDDFKGIKYPYSSETAIVETSEGTYADKSADLSQSYVMWNHGLSTVIKNLLHQNLKITYFEEYNWSPYACFKHTVEFEKGKFKIPQFGDKIPLMYALEAIKE